MLSVSVIICFRNEIISPISIAFVISPLCYDMFHCFVSLDTCKSVHAILPDKDRQLPPALKNAVF